MKCENCGKEHDGSYGSKRFCSKKCRMQWIGKQSHKTAVKNGTLKNNLSKYYESIRKPYGTWKCSICGEVLETRTKLTEHRRELHKDVIPGTHNKGGVAWNKGLTKETNEIIKETAEKVALKYASGELVPPWIGRSHTEEEKKKISETMKGRYKGRSRWFTQIEKRKSYAEQYFEKIFTNAERNFHVDRYFLDFAWPEKKIYIEVDGEQHYNDEKVIQHDIERTEVLNKLGWTLLKRIRWSEFQKMSSSDKSKFIDGICSKITEV